MLTPKPISALLLSAANYLLVDIGTLAVKTVLLQCRTGVDVYLSDVHDPTQNYMTLKSGTSITMDFDGKQVTADVGSDKVTNGTFTGSATGWTFDDNDWSYGGNAIEKDADGVTTLSQDVSAVAAELYELQYTLSAPGGGFIGNVTPTLGGTAGVARTAVGTYKEYIRAVSTGNLIFTPTDLSRFILDTVSVKKVTRSSLYAKAASGTPYLEIFILN